MALPNSKSQRLPGEREKLKHVVARRNLCGLANDTKWDEFIDAMRAHIQPWTDQRVWRPNFRFKCVDGPPSGWDGEWCYHLPFPMLSTEWLDIFYIQEIPVLDDRTDRHECERYSSRVDRPARRSRLLFSNS